MKQLPLHGRHGVGHFAVVDDTDYPEVSGYRWHRTDRGYVCRSGDRSGTRIPLHRHLLIPPPDMEVDHINGDKLDNRRANLRICTHQQNVRNAPRISRSGYRGVQRVTTRTPTWYAHIAVNGKKRYLGSFSTPMYAARAYDKAAKQLHGEFGILNFPI